MMRLEQLSFLTEIARLNSISKAAETLYISQPALSAALKNLEEELGVALFNRTSRGLFLTVDGQRIHDEALQVLEIINGWRNKRPEEPSGEVRLLCTSIISSHITPNIIVPFQKTHPKVTVMVQNAQAQDFLSQLKSSRAHIALTTLPAKSNLIGQILAHGWENRLLFTDERRIFIGATHPLSGRAELTREDLRKLVLAYYSHLKDQISGKYAPYFASSYRLANKEDILDLVIAGEAVFIQPCRLFRQDFRMVTGLMIEKAIPISEIDPSAEIHALRIETLSAAELLFWDYLVAHFADNL